MPAVDRAELVSALCAAVGRDHVLDDPELAAAYFTDWTGRFHGHGTAVVCPGTVAEVEAVVAVCRRYGVGLVPQGGNTGLVGGSVPRDGDVVVHLGRFDIIEPFDRMGRQVTVGAGVHLADLQRAAARQGLRYAVDFGARDTATVGGSIATNAGGINFVRFGGTRQQLMGVEAVLGTGQVVRRLGGLGKDNTGFDLTGLLCGSEGTLGIVTRARLRVVPLHVQRVTALIGVAGVSDAVQLTVALRDQLESLEAAEVMLADGVGLVCTAFDLAAPLPTAWPAYLLVEAAADTDPSDALAAILHTARGVGDIAVAAPGDGAARRDALWRYREGHTLALRTAGPTIKLDVTVPLPALAEFMATLPAAVAAHTPGVRTWLFGHVGDGNLHVNLTGHRSDDAAEVHDLEHLVLSTVVAAGGCISAEHGIGTMKAPWLGLDRSADEIAAMRAIKHALDPDNVMNPGVIFSGTSTQEAR